MSYFKDVPGTELIPPQEIVRRMFEAAQGMKAATVKDDGPNRVKLPSGEYLVGEGADMFTTLQNEIIRMLEVSVYHLERQLPNAE